MRYLVCVYECEQRFGGPEEGGWWYDSGCLVRVMKVFRSADIAYDFCRRLNSKLNSRVFGPNQGKREYTSVLSDGEYQAHVLEDSAPKYFPESRPHYE